ncbi:MAG: DUF3833 domain-containing protein [Rhodobiaceae bacterium]|nr:DUF3833 domain-containing protein [Rhodobiaceae bacterium]
MLTALALISGVLVLTALKARFLSFAAQTPDDYKDTAPAFEIDRALSGPLACEGIIFGPTGLAVSRFVARMDGRWDAEGGTLAEHFTYDSGRQQRREWRIRRLPDNRITATADDIIGTAKGQISGATLSLSYRLRLPKEAGGHVLDVIDWLYLMPDGTLMNRSRMHRFGLPLAELVATMRPIPANA